MGAGLQQIFYLLAFSNAPAAEADIIIYLWPVLAVVCCSVIFREKILPRYWLAAAMGLTAVTAISAAKLQSGSALSVGHLCALLCAVSWAGYSVLAQRMKEVGTYIMGVIYGLMALLFGLYAFAQGIDFVSMTSTEILVLLFHAGTITFAFNFWTVGVQQGKAKQLTVSCYMKPVLSLLLLNFFGFAELTPVILGACMLVALSGLIAQGGVVELLSIVASQHRGLALELGHRYRKCFVGYAIFSATSFTSALREVLHDATILSCTLF